MFSIEETGAGVMVGVELLFVVEVSFPSKNVVFPSSSWTTVMFPSMLSNDNGMVLFVLGAGETVGDAEVGASVRFSQLASQVDFSLQ